MSRKRKPLYKEILDSVKREIYCRWKPGEELPGDNQLARQYQVSPIVVREALTVLREEGLVDRKVGSGTRVRVPRIGKRQVVAVLIDLDLTNPGFPTHYFPGYEYIRRRFDAVGIEAKFYTGKSVPGFFPEQITSEEFIRDLRAGRIAAVVGMFGYPEQQYLDWAAEYNIPWLYIGKTGNAPIRIRRRMEHIVDQMVESLAALGKRRFALVGWQGYWDKEERMNERIGYFRKALEKCEAYTRDEWLRMDVYPGFSGAGWSQVRTLWTAGKEKPDAILFLDDVLYADAVPALLRLGVRVPEDLALGVHTFQQRRLPTGVPVLAAKLDQVEVSRVVFDEVMQVLSTGKVERKEIFLDTEVGWVGKPEEEVDEESNVR